jgi:hypothetical protein
MSRFLTNRGNYIVRQPFQHYLDTNGDGTGIENAIGDYSVGTTDFYYAPSVGVTAEVSKLIVHVADKGVFTFDGYGSLAAGVVVNGYSILFERLGVIALEITNGVPIVSNADMTHINVDYRKTSFSGNEEAAGVSLDQESFGGPLLMHGDLEDKLIVRLADNYTGLSDHHFIVYGKR